MFVSRTSRLSTASCPCTSPMPKCAVGHGGPPGGWGSGPLSVASDCSGLDSFLYALKSLGLPPQDISLEFCSDKDEHGQAFIRHAHRPRIMYTDITKHIHHLAPAVDLYFARLAQGQGWTDREGGPVFQQVHSYIKEKQPKCFIIENAHAFIQKRHMQALTNMETLLRKAGYLVTSRVLNSVHFGLPHSHPRLFFIGFHKQKCPHARRFCWPPQNSRPPPVSSIVCGGDLIKTVSSKTPAMEEVAKVRKALKTKYKDFDQQPFVIDVWRKQPRAWRDVVPCLTAQTTSDRGYYYLPESRFFTLQELCRLRGLPTKIIAEANEIHLPVPVCCHDGVPVLRAVIGRVMHVFCHS